MSRRLEIGGGDDHPLGRRSSLGDLFGAIGANLPMEGQRLRTSGTFALEFSAADGADEPIWLHFHPALRAQLSSFELFKERFLR